MRTFAFLLLALLASPTVFIAQAPPAPATAASKAAFTADDMLKVATLSVLDLSDDGRQVAVAARRLQDNAEVDNTRSVSYTHLTLPTIYSV